MSKLIMASLLCVLAGCASTSQTPQPEKLIDLSAVRSNSPDRTDPYDFGTRTVPGTTIQYDYSEDFYSWHYHARERDATAEEIAVHAVDEQIEAAKQNGDEVRLNLLNEAKVTLQDQFEPVLKVQAEQDKVRYRRMMKDLAAQQNNSAVVVKGH